MKTAYFDGVNVKGFNIPDPWHSVDGWMPAAEPTAENELYGRVAALYRAINLTADALSSVPFAIVKGKKDFDLSTDWQNKVGFMPNPVGLLRLWRMSLFATNAAYGFMEYNLGKKLLRYIVPTTITPDPDMATGEHIGYTRNTGLSIKTWPVGDISPTSPIFHIWRLDHTTELFPSKYSEMYACMDAAGILRWSDYFVEEFFKRGGIVPHLLMVKGVPSPAAQEKIENVFSRLIKSAYREVGKVFNAEAFDVKPLAQGIESLKDIAIRDSAIANIAMAAGMPLSLLLANSANYATAQAEYYSWYVNSVFPWCAFIAESITEHLFEPLGLKFEFRPEQAAPDQEQEVQRATAFSSYADTLLKVKHPNALSLAAQIVGVDLPQGVEYKDLDFDYEEEPEPEPQQVPPQLAAFQSGEQAQLEQVPQVEQEDEEDEDKQPAKFVPSFDQFNELHNWRASALRKYNQGKAIPVDYQVTTVPQYVADKIRAHLATATDEQSIKAAFDFGVIPAESEIVTLANAINRLADK